MENHNTATRLNDGSDTSNSKEKVSPDDHLKRWRKPSESSLKNGQPNGVDGFSTIPRRKRKDPVPNALIDVPQTSIPKKSRSTAGESLLKDVVFKDQNVKHGFVPERIIPRRTQGRRRPSPSRSKTPPPPSRVIQNLADMSKNKVDASNPQDIGRYGAERSTMTEAERKVKEKIALDKLNRIVEPLVKNITPHTSEEYPPTFPIPLRSKDNKETDWECYYAKPPDMFENEGNFDDKIPIFVEEFTEESRIEYPLSWWGVLEPPKPKDSLRNENNPRRQQQKRSGSDDQKPGTQRVHGRRHIKNGIKKDDKNLFPDRRLERKRNDENHHYYGPAQSERRNYGTVGDDFKNRDRENRDRDRLRKNW